MFPGDSRENVYIVHEIYEVLQEGKRDKPVHPPLILNNTIEDVTDHENLGLTLSSNLSWL